MRHLLFHAIWTVSLLLPALAAPAADDEEARALLLIKALGCRGCHRLGGEGGSIAPALDQVGSRLNAEEIRARLAGPNQGHHSLVMPVRDYLDEKELNLLARYLENLK